MGMVRNIERKRESNKHGKLSVPTGLQEPEKGGFEICLATDVQLL